MMFEVNRTTQLIISTTSNTLNVKSSKSKKYCRRGEEIIAAEVELIYSS